MDTPLPTDFLVKNRNQLETLSRELERLTKATDLDDGFADMASADLLLVNRLISHAEAYSVNAARALSHVGGEFDAAVRLAADPRKQQRQRAIRAVAIAGARVAIENILKTGQVSNEGELPLLRHLSRNTIPLGDEGVLEPIWRLLLLRDTVLQEVRDHTQRAEELEKRVGAARTIVEVWDGKLADYRRRIDSLLEEYNFIGFTKAFSEMRKEVQASRSASRLLMWAIGVVAFVPALVLASAVFFSAEHSLPKLLVDSEQRLYVLVPSVFTFEVLCIYFFRVVLRNFQSAAAQASQLSLRMAACAFIQQYVEFSKNQKPETLEKFEALVFSGLAVDPGKVPSTFDGLDQLISAVRSVKESTA